MSVLSTKLWLYNVVLLLLMLVVPAGMAYTGLPLWLHGTTTHGTLSRASGDCYSSISFVDNQGTRIQRCYRTVGDDDRRSVGTVQVWYLPSDPQEGE